MFARLKDSYLWNDEMPMWRQMVLLDSATFKVDMHDLLIKTITEVEQKLEFRTEWANILNLSVCNQITP